MLKDYTFKIETKNDSLSENYTKIKFKENSKYMIYLLYN